MAIISLSSLMSPFPIGTFIAVGVGVGVFLLFVMVIMVVIILVAVFVKRKAVYKQKRDTTMRDNLHCTNTVVEKQEIELKGATRQKMDQRDYGFTATNNYLYAMPMSKICRMTDKGLVVVVNGGEKRAPLGPVICEEVDKQDTQTDGHTKHYQELDLAKMERREYASIKV